MILSGTYIFRVTFMIPKWNGCTQTDRESPRMYDCAADSSMNQLSLRIHNVIRGRVGVSEISRANKAVKIRRRFYYVRMTLNFQLVSGRVRTERTGLYEDECAIVAGKEPCSMHRFLCDRCLTV